jgi:hypothetical protein
MWARVLVGPDSTVLLGVRSRDTMQVATSGVDKSMVYPIIFYPMSLICPDWLCRDWTVQFLTLFQSRLN